MNKSKLLITCFLLLSLVVIGGCSKKVNDNTNSNNSTKANVSNSTAVNTAKSDTTSNTANSTTTSSTTSNTADSNAASDTTSQTFTADDLKKYNGQNGNPAYVAVNGTVYDVTNAKGWSNGSHQGLSAGKDLTSELANSPHGDSVLANLPVVGTLK
jgi:predicted heme/steroid binding protein